MSERLRAIVRCVLQERVLLPAPYLECSEHGRLSVCVGMLPQRLAALGCDCDGGCSAKSLNIQVGIVMPGFPALLTRCRECLFHIAVSVWDP